MATLCPVDTLCADVMETVSKLSSSRDLHNFAFRSLLRTMVQMRDFAWYNQVLIWLQCPAARRLASYDAWKQCGRTVTRGARGVAILTPVTDSACMEGALPFEMCGDFPLTLGQPFRKTYVFSESDTVGPTAVRRRRGSVPRLAETLAQQLTSVAERQGIKFPPAEIRTIVPDAPPLLTSLVYRRLLAHHAEGSSIPQIQLELPAASYSLLYWLGVTIPGILTFDFSGIDADGLSRILEAVSSVLPSLIADFATPETPTTHARPVAA